MIKKEWYEEDFFQCSCASGWHCSCFTVTRDIEENSLYVSTLMSPGNFWHRCKQVWGFLFGGRSNLHFDNFIFDNEDIDRLMKLLKRQQEERPNINA